MLPANHDIRYLEQQIVLVAALELESFCLWCLEWVSLVLHIHSSLYYLRTAATIATTIVKYFQNGPRNIVVISFIIQIVQMLLLLSLSFLLTIQRIIDCPRTRTTLCKSVRAVIDVNRAKLNAELAVLTLLLLLGLQRGLWL